MLKRLVLTLAGSVVCFIACAPPGPQASFKADKDKTEKTESDETSGDDEGCVDDDDTATLAPKSSGALSGLVAEDYDACACQDGGSARCVPRGTIPANFSSQLGACEGGVCVPDSLIASGGAAPKTCKSIAGEGRCMSLCIPKVAERIGLLHRGDGDVCEEDELCVPCLNPLEGNKPTGVCEIGGASKSSKASGKKCGKKTTTNEEGPTTGDANACPYAGAPIDVSKFEACGDGGRCVPAAGVPEALRARLSPCAGGLCAPEKSVKNAAKYRPPTCEAVGGAEGRCLSIVIKDVAAKKGLLQQGSCEANELCAPCFSPTDGSDTGACRSVSCDAPKEPAKTFAKCCEGKGTCVPESAVTNASQKERLGDDGCVEGAELCAPTEDIGRTTKRTPCNGVLKLLNKPYAGACVSRCTKLGIKGIFLDQASCDDDHVCAACVDPTTGESTGACD